MTLEEYQALLGSLYAIGIIGFYSILGHVAKRGEQHLRVVASIFWPIFVVFGISLATLDLIMGKK
jgi:hypothetical protein